MIDQNRDGLIDVSDLKEMYSNLGMYSTWVIAVLKLKCYT